jgi:uncharacterized protein (DUF697 family)
VPQLRSSRESKAGGVGKIAGAKQVYSLIRGMSIEEIEESVRQPPRILVVSRTNTVDDLIEDLTGVRGTPSIVKTTPANLPRDLQQFDVILVDNPDSNADYLEVQAAAGPAAWRTFDIGPAQDRDRISALRERITDYAGDGAVALGRWYPGLRSAAARSVINGASRSNAQFALLASAPSVLPMIGSVASAGADIIVLTKNQLTMAIKLAAIYGKPLNNKWDIFRDLMPVVGAGFMWRSVAREAIGFLPFAAGTIPKVAIAYAGTYSTGKAVEVHFRFNITPSKEQVTSWYRQALATARLRFPDMPELPRRSA